MPSMTVTIPNDKYPTFKEYFLKTYPNQTEDIANPLKFGYTAPLTDDQWIKYRILLFLFNGYAKAKRTEWEEGGPNYDDEIVED
jgi:hypothetical protein